MVSCSAWKRKDGGHAVHLHAAEGVVGLAAEDADRGDRADAPVLQLGVAVVLHFLDGAAVEDSQGVEEPRLTQLPIAEDWS